MGSIIGQAMQGAGPTLGAIGSSIGSLFGPSTASAATPPTVDNAGITAPAAPDTSSLSFLSDPAGAMSSFASPSGMSVPNYYGAPASTGIGGTTPGSPFTPTATDPTTGTPADTGFWASLGKALGIGDTGTPTGTAAAGTPGATGAQPSLLASILKMAPGAIVDLLKYQQQQNLLSPSAINANAQQLAQNQARMLKKSIFPAITATGQETGQINSPYLMDQAYTAAAAPTVAEINANAYNQWLNANRLAAGMYPGASDISALGGLVSPNIFGGSNATG